MTELVSIPIGALCFMCLVIGFFIGVFIRSII